MPPLPILSGREAVEIFRRLGWRFMRQQGSHMILEKDNHPENLAVPNHRTLKRGTLRGLIRRAGLTVEEFVDTLKRK